MMNLMHWRLLVAVADAGCVSRAAAQMGITQSGASQAISQLEDMLGVKVLLRDRRCTTATAIGQQVIEQARRMIAEWESIKSLVDASRGLHTGRIKLATFPSVFTSLLPSFLQSFGQQYPGINVISLNGTDEEIEAWLAEGSVDAGVVMDAEPERDAFVLARDAWVAVMPNNHPLARRSSSVGVSLQELADEPYVLATGGCSRNSRRLIENAGYALSDVRIAVRDWSTAFELIREGMGLSLVPESTLPGKQHGLRVLNLDTPMYREFGLVCSEAGRRTPAVQAFFDQLRRTRGVARRPAHGHGSMERRHASRHTTGSVQVAASRTCAAGGSTTGS
ncbi:LysR family transcriptional regulator [Paraburkholderia kururiensis]|uniref:LysR family transcriptional regulator n=1 Tax=Paraburkholderia kururiensis TaxID=984307 RepID=UPI0009DC95BD|nr:LysR family transcriptional regulator [Paraburkholderia kururiensis]